MEKRESEWGSGLTKGGGGGDLGGWGEGGFRGRDFAARWAGRSALFRGLAGTFVACALACGFSYAPFGSSLAAGRVPMLVLGAG